MSITSELEKLSSLRERGDLSDAEFEQAKALLLSGKDTASEPPPLPSGEAPAEKNNRGMHLAIAICTTVAAVMSAISAALDPNAPSFASLLIWSGLSIYWWISLRQGSTS